MEKKQLNLNAPFYSVRRYSSPKSHSSELTKPKSFKDKPLLPPSRQQSLPLSHKSEHKRDDEQLTTKPASVPFHWEQTPGTPKFESPRPSSNSSIRFFSGEIPKPPPGRLSRFTSGEIPKPPPGRALSSGPSRFTSGDRSNDQQLHHKPQVDAFSFRDDHARLLEKLNESFLKCKEEDGSKNGDDDCSDAAYSDALDALSLSSGSHAGGSRAKPSGTFSVDARTRDLMMDRFLPAAKAAVLETPPQYNGKKKGSKPKVVVKKMVNEEVKKPAVVKKHSLEGALSYYYDTHNYVYDQESSDDEESRIPVKKPPGKRWGIIPRFCVKNSLCMLNPLPALKSIKSRPQTPSFGEARRLPTRNALSGPLDKIACPVPHKKKSHSGLLSRELPKIEGKRSKSGQLFSNPRDSYSLSTSPLRRYRSGNSSPCRNEIPKSPSRQGSGFSIVPNKVDNNINNNKFNDSKLALSRKLFKALQDVSRNQKNDKGSSATTLLGRDQNLKANDKGLGNKPWPLGNIVDESEIKRVIREERRVESNESTESEFVLKSTLTPPLPKSPSESWLWRTLPLGNPFSRKSPARSNKNGQIDSNVDAKWETIVKSSNLQRDRFRYSQELTPRLSHRQRQVMVKET